MGNLALCCGVDVNGERTRDPEKKSVIDVKNFHKYIHNIAVFANV